MIPGSALCIEVPRGMTAMAGHRDDDRGRRRGGGVAINDLQHRRGYRAYVSNCSFRRAMQSCSNAMKTLASSSLSAQRQAGSCLRLTLELRGHSPEFGRHLDGDVCITRVVRMKLEMLLEMDECRGCGDGGGCEDKVSGDDGWRRSLRCTLAMHVCQA
jgi:hypothetical protein